MWTMIIQQSFAGLLYQDGVFERVLEPGRYRLWRLPFQPRRRIELVDLRQQSLVIKGQEILTQDKVAIRVSLLVYFKVTDPVAAKHSVASFETRIYEDIQLAARRFLASRSLEAILNDRNEISDAVLQAVHEGAQGYGVDILRADVKDLVFPGNLREIMNQVLETERRAEAKLIQAKKEIEAERLRSQAENEARLRQLEARREQLRLELDAEKQREDARREREQLRLETELAEARAVADHRELLMLRELETLKAMAENGGRFVVGLNGAPGSLWGREDRG